MSGPSDSTGSSSSGSLGATTTSFGGTSTSAGGVDSTNGSGIGGASSSGGASGTLGTTQGGMGGAGPTSSVGGATGTTGESAAGGSAGTAGGGAGGGTAGTGGAPAACETNQISTCSGSNPIECHFGGSPGDYQVTMELGGSTAADMYIEAESYRRVLGPITTLAGEVRRVSFFVNVRQPEGQPIQDVSPGTPGLDLYVRGSAPLLSSVCYESKRPAPKLWIAGDSTVCDQDGTAYAGWGQHLPQFFGPAVSVANLSDSGESSGSFLGSGNLWGAIKAGWAAEDWVMIQLGHNDKNVSGATFQSNISRMVTEAKAAGVHPILITPTSRVGYDLEEEHVNSVGADLPQIVRDVAASENVPVIDLTVTTWYWLEGVDWTEYFALGTDHTHTNPRGAEVIAGFVRDAVLDQGLDLATYLR